MSWLFSRALVEEYSPATSLDGGRCAPLSVMPTRHKFWRSDKMMEPSDLSRFGLTCAVLTEDSGAALLTLYLVAFHARTSVSQVQAPDWRERAAASGLNSVASWAKFDPVSCSLKTAQLSLLEDSPSFLPTLPQSGLMLDGRCYQLDSLAPATSVTAPGSLPTPLKSWGRRGPGLSNNLDNLRCSLGTTLASLAIVKACGWRWPASFVEWMMGWPTQWSALKPLEMDKFRQWERLHGKYSQGADE